VNEMNMLKLAVQAHIKKYGTKQLTNSELLNILTYAQQISQRREEKEDRFFSRIAAECTDPNA